jgi:hypothetical protein
MKMGCRPDPAFPVAEVGRSEGVRPRSGVEVADDDDGHGLLGRPTGDGGELGVSDRGSGPKAGCCRNGDLWMAADCSFSGSLPSDSERPAHSGMAGPFGVRQVDVPLDHGLEPPERCREHR